MTEKWTTMLLALREWRRFSLPLGLWFGITLVTGIAGPFGTYDALPGPARMGY